MFRYANETIYLNNSKQGELYDELTILLDIFKIYEPKTLIDNSYQEIVYNDTIKYEIQNNNQIGIGKKLLSQIKTYTTQFDTYKKLEAERVRQSQNDISIDNLL